VLLIRKLSEYDTLKYFMLSFYSLVNKGAHQEVLYAKFSSISP
jgi:hypothetical protein